MLSRQKARVPSLAGLPFMMAAVVLFLAAVVAMSVDAAQMAKTTSVVNGKTVSYSFRVTNGFFEEFVGVGAPGSTDGWITFGFVAGMNLGATKPGYDPGELPLTKGEYIRAFKYMQSVYSNVVRVYTVLTPEFYEAVAEFNAGTTDPIYVLHGIWTPEEELIGDDNNGRNAYDADIKEIMETNIRNVLSAVYGRGDEITYAFHKSGTYSTDISQWVVGWLMGTEWYPFAVNVTNVLNAGLAPYQGTFVACTAAASPFESWVGMMLDLLLKLDHGYGMLHPASFVNWVTTDPLVHPSEPGPPISQEDWQTVDALHIIVSSGWTAGSFINFHAYPYYPEYMNFIDPRDNIPWIPNVDQADPYIGYLLRLRAYFPGQALIITEVGLPTSIGNSHFGYKGRNHGSMTEVQQGQFMASIIQILQQVNIQGICLFQLIDEWFKKNWNTLKVDVNRKVWHNHMSSEQFYGLIAAEVPQTITVDGLANDWPTTMPNYLAATALSTGLRRMHMRSDASFLYIMVERNGNWLPTDELWVAFDTVASQGSFSINAQDDNTLYDIPVEYAFSFTGNAVNMYLNGYFDLYLRGPGEWVGAIEDATTLYDSRRGLFSKWTQITKNPAEYIMPDGSSIDTPPEVFIGGEMIRGTTDFTDPYFNNMATWQSNGSIFEIRVPWMMLGFSDPSTRQVYTLTGSARTLGYNFETSPGVGFQTVFNHAKDDKKFFDMPTWTLPCFCERVKKSAVIVAQAFKASRNLGDSPIYGLDGLVQEYCECPTETSNLLGDVLSNLLLGSILFVTGMLAIVGVIRPVVSRIMYCYTYRKSRTDRSIGVLQGLAVALLACILITVYVVSVSTGKDMFQVVKDFSNTVDGNGSNSGTMEDQIFQFVFYMLLLNYDAILLLCLALFIRWPKPAPVPAADAGTAAMLAATCPPIKGTAAVVVPIASTKDQDTAATAAAAAGDKPKVGRHAFIISCHNSSAKIRNTIINIMKRSEPWQIFVADNGSSEKERIATEEECKALSAVYSKSHPNYRGRGVNFGTLTEGSKTVAQFASVFNLRNYPTQIDFVTLIDDDTIVPDNWTEAEVVGYFDRNEHVKCLAYPLHARNTVHTLAYFQDLEYLLAGYMKVVQARLGTALFASGAFNTWRTEYITDILFRHDTMHHGDDLQQGLLLHSLAKRPWILDESRKHEAGYKVDTAATIVVGTDVPLCWFHSRDIVPSFMHRWYKPPSCDCGEPSLFLQRGKGWEVSRQRFLWKYLKMIFTLRAITCWTGFWARVVALYDVALILNDWILFLYGIVILVMSANPLFLVKAMIVAWAVQTFVYFIFGWLVLTPAQHPISPEVKVLFPVIYKLPVLFGIRIYGMLYNIFYYLPFVRNKTKVRARFNRQTSFRGKIEGAFNAKEEEAKAGANGSPSARALLSADSADEQDMDNIAKLLQGENVDAFDLSEHVAQLRRRATNLDRELRNAVMLYAQMRGDKPRSGMMRQLSSQLAEQEEEAQQQHQADAGSLAAGADDAAAGVGASAGAIFLEQHRQRQRQALTTGRRASNFVKSLFNASVRPGGAAAAGGHPPHSPSSPSASTRQLQTELSDNSALSVAPSYEELPPGDSANPRPAPRRKTSRPVLRAVLSKPAAGGAAGKGSDEQRRSLERYIAERKEIIQAETAAELNNCKTDQERERVFNDAAERVAKLERDGALSLKLVTSHGRKSSIQSLYSADLYGMVAKYNEQKDALIAQGIVTPSLPATAAEPGFANAPHRTAPQPYPRPPIAAPSLPGPPPIHAIAPPRPAGPVPKHVPAPPPPPPFLDRADSSDTDTEV
ncbi:hypothetical protein CAOG_05310 [Capsaspora owczarzaki ATCC 30864]|uniref:Glycosyltransferase 2-like domain-containing protein n=1 Tax=Capsaspora owczarzaki (strain ATCC 30864) TaxID=595528 RepID=A0A0D2UHX9_CAPO3|nr:hypothetical protein CAOG_05310 [Capsaspora owczarzaki ATCC 30864]KJE94711.1 hypothetical protein CAOG_005310 [Capsaspora owczarzaki ATCC 30864]|eukprot:XP_004346995.2 hypothetical protein CAOG_05310 [Capsaspora owczarzaki ATCC 30864]